MWCHMETGKTTSAHAESQAKSAWTKGVKVTKKPSDELTLARSRQIYLNQFYFELKKCVSAALSFV